MPVRYEPSMDPADTEEEALMLLSLVNLPKLSQYL